MINRVKGEYRMKRHSVKLMLGLLLLLALLVGCGGEAPTPIVIVVTSPPSQPTPTAAVVQPTPTAEVVQPPPPAAGIEIVEATFAHGLGDDMQPVNPGADFVGNETIYLSLKIKGRPKEGVVTARFYWRDTPIAEAGVDLADVNSGLLFSVGEDTFAGYTLTHQDPFPVSDKYRADVSSNDQPLGTYAFRVIPPPDAIPSQVKQVTLAKGADENYNPVEPTTTFATDETVYLVGRGDLGLDTWIQADWYVSGQLDEAGTRSITLQENASDVGFSFSFLPEGGWPSGEHLVVMTMNDQEVGRYSFTVTP
jgi:hypothetical protein